MNALMRLALILVLLALAPAGDAGVKDSLHNLSASGPGNVKSPVADRVCEFCHVSHSAGTEGALWSRRRPAANYIPYSSSTVVAQPGQPTGTSVLCLSCHDGTIALGEILNRSPSDVVSGSINVMPPGRGLQGTDLRDDHPISFRYSASLAAENGELVAPGLISRTLPLDPNGELQCTTCHDAHDSPYEKLLLMPNIGSQLCVECHNQDGWAQTSHSQSVATWNGRRPDPWADNDYSTVSDNGCGNCHVSHGARGSARLLKNPRDEDNCGACHNGNVAQKDVMAAFDLGSSHRVQDYSAVHDPVEPAVIDARHVECADCHDPHATRMGRQQGEVPANVRGISLDGVELSEATSIYEICLRCHGDSPNQPMARTPRQHDQANMRFLIQPDNPSSHPVAVPGQNDDVPSLIFPLTSESVIGCGGCHNSSSAESVGGTGPEGPHGSAYAPLLARNYLTLDNTPESASAYALCYGCHSRDSILNDESFAGHRRHVEQESTPCNACHDPHGISRSQGTDENNSHLINFDTSIVFPNNNGQLRFVDYGDRAGSCDLLCHDENHDNAEYLP